MVCDTNQAKTLWKKVETLVLSSHLNVFCFLMEYKQPTFPKHFKEEKHFQINFSKDIWL